MLIHSLTETDEHRILFRFNIVAVAQRNLHLEEVLNCI